MRAGHRALLTTGWALCFVIGYGAAGASPEAAPVWARLFWTVFGFSQGYLACAWSPFVAAWAAERIARSLDRRRLRR